MRVPFFHELALGGGTVVAVHHAWAGHLRIVHEFKFLLADVIGLLVGGQSIGQGGGNGQRVNDGASVVGNQVYGFAGRQGEIRIERTVRTAAAAPDEHYLTRPQFGT